MNSSVRRVVAGPSTTGRLPAVDGLRTAAVAVVVGFHMFPARVLGGAVGVDVFFVISGFVITRLLLKERDATGRVRVGSFYVRRWLRLMPALMTVCATVLALSLWQPRGLFVRQWVGALFGMTYTMNFARGFGWASSHSLWATAHTWSLGIEEQFYLVWPALLLLLLAAPRRVRTVLWAVLLLVPSLLRVAEWNPVHYMSIYDMPQTRFDELMVGGALAFLLARVPADRVLRVARPLFWPSAAVLVYAAFEVPVGQPGLWYPARYWGFGFLLLALLTAVVVACLALDPGMPAGRILGSRVLSEFARRYSYSVYLWHYVVLYAVTLTGHGGVRRILLEVPAVAILSWLTYRFIERPALRRKRRYEVVGRPVRPAVPDADVALTVPVPRVAGLSRHEQASDIVRTGGERFARGSLGTPVSGGSQENA